MSIQWRATDRVSGYETEATLAKADAHRNDLGVLRLVGGTEVLLTVAELRELASVATLIADQIEAQS